MCKRSNSEIRVIYACQIVSDFNAQLLIPPVDGSDVKKEQEGDAFPETFARQGKKDLGVGWMPAH